MCEPILIRVPSHLADELVADGLVERISSDGRSSVVELVVHASILTGEVSSVLVAVGMGVRGVRAVLDWLGLRGGEDRIELTIHSESQDRAWSFQDGQLTPEMRHEIYAVLNELEADYTRDAASDCR
jgi:hypothetical protein